MASAVSPASLTEDSTITSAISSVPAKKSWLEIRLVRSVKCFFTFHSVPFRVLHLIGSYGVNVATPLTTVAQCSQDLYVHQY